MVELKRGVYSVSTDKSRLDLEVIHNFLSKQAYWAEGVPLDIVKKSIENSICFGVYEKRDEKRDEKKEEVNPGNSPGNSRAEIQVGFCRVITDKATFAYLSDVFILPEYRGQGLSKLLMEAVMNYPDLANIRTFSLFTRDAHGLYQQFGFAAHPNPEKLMIIQKPDIYKPGEFQKP